MALPTHKEPTHLPGPAGDDLNRPTLSELDEESIEAGLDEAGVEDLISTPGGGPPRKATEPTGTPAQPPPEPAPKAKEPPGAPAPKATPKGTPGATPKTAPTGPSGPTAPPAAQPGATGQPAPTGAPKAPDPEKDAEVEAIQEPKGLNPASRENWKKLQQTATQRKESADRLQAEVADLRQKLTAQPQVPEGVIKEIEELRAFRRTFDIQHDPEFEQKYEKAIVDNEADIYALMKQYGVDDKSIDSIKNTQAKSGVKGTRALSSEFWNTNVLDPLRKSNDPDQTAAAQIIEEKLKQNNLLTFEKRKAIETASVAQSEWQKNRQAEFTKRNEENVKIVRDRVNQAIKDIGWVGKKEVPADATAEQKEQIETHNQFVQDTEDRLKVALNPQTPLQRAEVALACCMSFIQLRDIQMKESQLQEKDAEITRLTGEMEKMKAAKVTSGGGKSLPSKPATAPTQHANPGMRDEAAIDAGLDEAGA